MSEFQPQQFSFLYGSNKSEGKSLDEIINLAECNGHVLRDSESGKFLYFPDILKLSNYFVNQDKPHLHSVINKHHPMRFNLELDMPISLLDEMVFSPANIKKIESENLELNLIKSLKALEHIQGVASDILEEFGVESSDYTFMNASDNRKDKYSYRFYLKLAFENIHEYKHFTTLLKQRVRPELLPMIDPTSLMLRTPNSYKDGHCCKWDTHYNIEESILSYTDNCDMIESQGVDSNEEMTHDELTSDDIKKAVAIISTHPDIMGNFSFIGENKGFLNLKRIQPSYCNICKKEHDNIDAYATIYRGNVYLRCFRDETKSYITLGQNNTSDILDKTHIGFVGDAEPFKFCWSDIKKMMRAHEKLKLTGMSNKELKVLSNNNKQMFEEVKVEASKNTWVVAAIKKFVFTDFIKFHGKTFIHDEHVLTYIRQTIVKIIMGGNSLYITSDEWKNTKHFTELSMLPLSKNTEAYMYSIVNLAFDTEQPIDKFNKPTFSVNLSDTINKITMMEFYKSVDFIPYLVKPIETNKDIFNMFEGFRYPYIKGQVEIKQSVVPWIDHILNIICCGDVELAKTLTQWMAHIVQIPAEKAFAIILYGKQGTGKSILYEFFTRCIGKDLGLQVGKLEDLTQTHNTHVRGKLIVNANEATNEPAIRDVNILKGLITETDLIINPKGVNQYTVSNYSRLMITSNYEQCMRLDKDDRRYMCLAISDSKKNNDDYFAPLIAGLTNEETQADFFNYLANYDIKDFKQQRPPLTNMKRSMIGMNVSNIVSYVLDVCENTIYTFDFEEEKVEIMPTMVELFDRYVTWCSQNDIKGRKHKKVSFIKEMSNLFGLNEIMPRIDGARTRRFKLNREELIPKFKEHYCRDDFKYTIA